MFGYVRPYKPELTFNEFSVYKSIYCGLCHNIVSNYGRIYSFKLNYDFVFIALLSIAINDKFDGFEKKTCSFNPIKKVNCLKPCFDLNLSSAISIIMMYYKFKDDYSDSKSFYKKISFQLVIKLLSRAYRKASSCYPFISDITKDYINQQISEELSFNTSFSLDVVAHPTAFALSSILPLLSCDNTQKKILARIGYLIGKWIYLIDALDDLPKDIKTGNFNPFINPNFYINSNCNFNSDYINDKIEGILNVILAELALSYELLTVLRYTSILDNIFYLGLKSIQKNIFEKRRSL